MRSSLIIFCSLLLAAFASSCVMTKTYTKEEKLMLVDPGNLFIMTKDGKKITGKKMTSGTSGKGKEKVAYLAIDGEKVSYPEIASYQDKNAYYARFGNDKNYRWVKQLKRGKINLYYYENRIPNSYYNGTKWVNSSIAEVHFVFQKANEDILEIPISLISEMLKNNAEAYKIFTGRFGSEDKKIFPKQLSSAPKVLFEAIDIYNGR